MPKQIGPTIGAELKAANLHEQVTFTIGGTDADMQSRGLTAQQQAALASLIAAHDPAAIPAADARAQTFRAEPDRIDLLDRLQTATPAQIGTWIDNNVTSIATARTVLKAIIKVIALDART